MYSRLRFIWIVEWRTSSIIWIASPLWTRGWGRVDRQRHRAGSRDLRERNDGQEELLPLHPPLLDLAEHVAPDRAVHRAEYTVVLLLLHREVGAKDLLQRVLLRGPSRTCSRSGTSRPARRRWVPGELLDLLWAFVMLARLKAATSFADRRGAGAGESTHAALAARLVPCSRPGRDARIKIDLLFRRCWNEGAGAVAEARSGATFPALRAPDRPPGAGPATAALDDGRREALVLLVERAASTPTSRSPRRAAPLVSGGAATQQKFAVELLRSTA